jgi:hypothetical protein
MCSHLSLNVTKLALQPAVYVLCPKLHLLQIKAYNVTILGANISNKGLGNPIDGFLFSLTNGQTFCVCLTL